MDDNYASGRPACLAVIAAILVPCRALNEGLTSLLRLDAGVYIMASRNHKIFF